MSEKKIETLEQYIKEVTNLAANLKIDVQYNEVLFFRGQSDKSFQLEPALSRQKCNYSNMTMVHLERNLIETAQLKLPSIFNTSDTPLNLLALLQHYGVPTRLLDITSNPLVALYFACNDNLLNDGEVFVFKDNQYDIATYPMVNAIADSYRFLQDTTSYLERMYRYVSEQPYFLEHKQMIQNPYDGADWIYECCQKPLFVHTKELSPRQNVQQGSYILFHNHIDILKIEPIESKRDHSYYFTKDIDPMLKEDECIIKRFIIPHNCKENILKQLSIFGIRKSTLFPDNVDFICREITESQRIRLTNPPCFHKLGMS